MDFRKYFGKPCLVTFRTGDQFWSYLYGNATGFTIRIENGWYKPYTVDGKGTISGYTVHKDGTMTPVPSEPESDIISVEEMEFDKAMEILKNNNCPII